MSSSSHSPPFSHPSASSSQASSSQTLTSPELGDALANDSDEQTLPFAELLDQALADDQPRRLNAPAPGYYFYYQPQAKHQPAAQALKSANQSVPAWRCTLSVIQQLEELPLRSDSHNHHSGGHYQDDQQVLVIEAPYLDSGLLRVLERLQLSFIDCPRILILARPLSDTSKGLESELARLLRYGIQEVLFQPPQPSQLAQLLTQARVRKAHEYRLTRSSHYDSLTGLANRTLLFERLAHSVKRQLRRQASDHSEQCGGLALLLLDIDQFHRINQRHGHAFGDQLLQACGQRLQQLIRDTDTLARIGANRFGLMLEGIDSDEQLLALADKLLRAFRAGFTINAQELFISTSIGIKRVMSGEQNASRIFEQCEQALSDAQQCGGGMARLFQARANQQKAQTAGLEAALSHALERNQICLAYQPQMRQPQMAQSSDYMHQQLVGFEALLRWRHPVLGCVPPGVFIPVLERSGLIEQFGYWVLNHACEQMASWRNQGLVDDGVRMSVNLSGRQFRQHDLLAQVEHSLAHAGLPPQALTLEVTETMLMDNLQQGAALLAQLRKLGVAVAMDDFGTGYSSLSYLKDLPLDYLKIDRAFVENIVDSKEDQAIARSIISLAHNLNLEVVAEGVEQDSVLQLLAGLGCDHYQGFLLGKPQFAETIERWLAQRLS